MSDKTQFLENRTWHADAGVVPDAIQTRAFVLARVGSALVDVLLAARPGVTPHAVTREGAVRVHTLTAVLARVGTWRSRGKKEARLKAEQAG